MPTLLYIHGFLSSPQSNKAQETQAWLRSHRPHWGYECPYLSSNPVLAKDELDVLMACLIGKGEEVFIIGSSLGGFWATYLVEHFPGKAVVVNPAVSPARRFAELVGEPIKNYHTDKSYTLTSRDIEVLKVCDVSTVANTDLYWLMVQKGDEVLDYRDSVVLYAECRQTVEGGGDHSFVGYQNWIPEIIDFFEH